MTGNELRASFLRYFESKGHTIVNSSSLVPYNDPTLLFTNAGMVQFKNVFLGLEKQPFSRATTAQKCVRAGGKHNDLDTVGRTARHHTFFEMMGNFSFGDYFKKEAIGFAWEYLTSVLELPGDRLYITIYRDDDEANRLWQEVTSVPAERIVRLGEKDNFWAMGETGPCGPCSEIIFDRGQAYACDAPECALGKCDCDRWLEIWNLVFMQYNRDEAGNLAPLPRPSIDTGMGLERVCSILQDVNSNFDTDLIRPLLHEVENLSGKAYYGDERGFPFRVIADHARACAFLISDGVLPGNEGRGYVLRRILRRAVRFGQSLNIEPPFLYRLVPVVCSLMGDSYTEVVEKSDYVGIVIQQEENRFQVTLSEGLKVAEEIISKAKEAGKNQVGGQEAFMLYDTFGFPIDLMEDIATEHNLAVDKEGFEKAMGEQRQRAKMARDEGRLWDTALALKGSLLEHIPPTRFVGYSTLKAQTKVLAIIQAQSLVTKALPGSEVDVVLEATPFYSEEGGQVADTGVIRWENGGACVLNVKKLPDGKPVHLVRINEGALADGDMVLAEVDSERRSSVARNHSATHLLHKSLKEVLGDHANQAGSMVAPDRLRFDFTHFAPLTGEEVQQIEARVNQQVLAALPVETTETSFDEARRTGATALFGEKYGDRVRVVKIGDYSLELCGGTHLQNTSAVGIFKIISEGGVGAGLRRIEAVTGQGAIDHLDRQLAVLQKASEKLKTMPAQLLERLEVLLSDNKEKGRELERLKSQQAVGQIDLILQQAQDVSGIQVIAASVQAGDAENLRSIGDLLKDRVESAVLVLASKVGSRVNFVAMVTKDLIACGLHAGNLIREIAKVTGGGGGGRPDMAQAGGTEPQKIEAALALVPHLVRQQLRSQPCSREGKGQS